jgi:hypothetical protein
VRHRLLKQRLAFRRVDVKVITAREAKVKPKEYPFLCIAQDFRRHVEVIERIDSDVSLQKFCVEGA